MGADATEEQIKLTLDEINDLEDQLDQAESKLVATESNLHLSLTRLDEVQRAKGVLVERGKAEDELSARLTAELEDLTTRNNDLSQPCLFMISSMLTQKRCILKMYKRSCKRMRYKSGC